MSACPKLFEVECIDKGDVMYVRPSVFQPETYIIIADCGLDGERTLVRLTREAFAKLGEDIMAEVERTK